MGNLELGQNIAKITKETIDFENSYMVPLHQVEGATLIKCIAQNNVTKLSKNSVEKQGAPLYFLEKMFASDSEEEFRFLARYLEKQSMFGFQANSSQLIKIVKIYQQVDKGLCSNLYLIRTLFEYSDITLRDQLRVRSGKFSHKSPSKSRQKQFFRYEDLCSIMFACISSLFTVQQMKQSFKDFMQQKFQNSALDFRQTQSLLSQFKYNIPLNLDRIIVMPDGTIKVIHPLILDHDSRYHHSTSCTYSPQKIRDFMMEDGIKGRIYEAAIIVLQCALIQNSEQINSIYNGYCINHQILSQKISKAQLIYQGMEGMAQQDLKLFSLIRKMTKTSPEDRINLTQCIKQAENLFQLNKKLKQSMSQKTTERRQFSHERMSIHELQFIPCHQIPLKLAPLQKSCTQQETVWENKEQYKTTAYRKSNLRTYQQNPQIEVSPFNQNIEAKKFPAQTRQNTTRSPLDSLFIIGQNGKEFSKNTNNECLQSLIGKNSDLYNTQKYNFLESKFQYHRAFCKISQIDKGIQQSSQSFSIRKEPKYKRILEQSSRNSSERKSTKNDNSFIRAKSIRDKIIENSQNSLITTSKFMDIDNIYTKYNFITHSNAKKNQLFDQKKENSFCQMNNLSQRRNKFKSNYSTNKKSVQFAYSLENSQSSWENETSKKSEVLEKITPQSIHKQERNIALR